ncbi:RICIN domain-containing protein [Streptomyces sp. NPDC047043]|uniref:RICIN domain-containing protein n=1 Tax=Streptomyces sp. NPDC047043 TaxID=3154497 RepID=UPI0033CD8D03
MLRHALACLVPVALAVLAPVVSGSSAPVSRPPWPTRPSSRTPVEPSSHPWRRSDRSRLRPLLVRAARQRLAVRLTAAAWEPLTARHSGKCLDVLGGIVRYTCDSGLNQDFWSRDAGSRFVRLAARHSGKCLDVADNSTADGNPVIPWPRGTGANQQWQVKDTSDGRLQLVSRSSGKCLHVSGAPTANGVELIQWPCGSGTHLEFGHGSA